MSKFKFDKILDKLQQTKSTLPKVLANDAKRFFLASWNKQGWDDGGIKPWAKRKKETKKTEGKAILVRTSTLRRAVATSLKTATFEKIKFEVTMPKGEKYPIYLNEGTNKMPKRQFMGDSKTLRKLLEKKLNLAIKEIWRG
jgi:hypothetical protein